MTPSVLSLCSGYGGLDLAVCAVFGAEVRWHAEIDKAACKVLEARWPSVYNLGDLTTADWTGVHADVLTAGYPCQPDSLAGKGLSTDDHRWIWPDIARAISCVGPRLVLLENVAGHLVRGFPTVLGSLADLGYDARWTTLRASDIGAPHGRLRVFIVAWPADTDQPRLEGRESAGRRVVPARSGWNGPTDSGLAAADTYDRADDGQWARTESRQGGTATPDTDSSQGGLQPVAEPRRGSAAFAGSGGQVATHPDRDGLARVGRLEPIRRDADGRSSADTAWGRYEPAVRRWERLTGRVAPAPTEPNTRGGQRLSPLFVEWMMGLPAGWVTAVPGISRNDKLKLLGNGVVPQQAAAALRSLLNTTTDQ